MNERKPAWTPLALVALMQVLFAESQAAGQPRAAQAELSRPVRRIVVSLPDCRLVVVENGTVLRQFAVAVGRPVSPSPVGTFTVVNRIDRPTYYAPGKVIPPSPRNPLGTRWLGLSVKGYGIHGTDEPDSIGHPRSHGCIRLRNRDIEALFEMVRPGDIVELHAERTPAIEALFTATDAQL